MSSIYQRRPASRGLVEACLFGLHCPRRWMPASCCRALSAKASPIYRADILRSRIRSRTVYASVLPEWRGIRSGKGSPSSVVFSKKSWSACGHIPRSRKLRRWFKELNKMYLDETFRLKVGLAEMLKGGVIMDVTNAEQAVIAEKAGACAVMALERVPADIRKEGGVARMAPISKIREIMHEVSIPVMAKARIGHFMEARILEALEVDYIDESEVLTPADEEHHIDKRDYKVPFLCGARNLGEALRRIAEGAAMIRTKGEAGSGNIVEAVRHIRTIVKEMKQLTVLGPEELVAASKTHQAPLELIQYVAKNGKLPVPNFSAGGISTPADAALVMQLRSEQ